MASNPPGECCTTGTKHDGNPTGKSIKVGQYDAYLATARGPRVERNKDVGILYVTDVIGIWQNSQLLADEFAGHGYTTLMMDLFNGDAIPMNNMGKVNLKDWMANGTDNKGGHTTKEIDPIIKEALAYMKNELGFKRIGAVGYCFGAKYVVRHYSSGIEVGFAAHPSFVEEEELEAISGPLSIAAAEVDTIFTVEKRHKSEEILQKTGQPYQINLFSGVNHGFAVRQDLKEKTQIYARAEALKQAVNFFDMWLL